MPDSLIYLEWFKMAEGDLRGAKIMFEHAEHECDYGWVAVICQQAIEKKLKGLILQKNNTLMRGHDLIDLCNLICAFDSDFKKFKKDLTFVSQYYIKARYPQEEMLFIPEEDARECIRIAQEIVNLEGVGNEEAL